MIDIKFLDKAKRQACEAHKGQRYKNFDYFTYHLLGILELLEKASSSDVEMVVAILHDTVEDTSLTLEDIEKDFGKHVAESVNAITKRSGETYEDYLQRVMSDNAAWKVKIYDVHFNLTECLKESDLKRAKHYASALHTLTRDL